MPKITPNITEEAKQVYEAYKGNKSKMVSDAIISYAKEGITLTDTDKEWIRKEIKSYLDKWGMNV